ncbi:MAG: hypothetical protein OHK0052_20670 [Anaerolineales bacterium]
MASGRMIQRDLLEQKAWGKLSPLARLLWHGLLLVADDQGRCIGNLPVVRSKVFAWDDLTLKEIDAALTELVQVKFVLRYTIGEDEYLQLLTWWEHQQMQYARPSAYPAPEGWQDRLRYNHSGKYIESNWREQTEPSVESPTVPPAVSPQEPSMLDHPDNAPTPSIYLDSHLDVLGSAPTVKPYLEPLNELNLLTLRSFE